MDKEFKAFRTSAFGGFNRKDVINYIEKMRNESHEYKKQVEETVKSLNEKILELENAARLIENDCMIDEEQSAQQQVGNLVDIGEATIHLKTVADELCRSLGEFMDKLDRKGLFENSESVCQIQECEEETQEESFVDGILSSISYLSNEDKSETCAVEKKQAEKSLDDIFSSFGFIN